MAFNVLVIGGDAAGLKAASRLRRLMPDACITVLERGDTISYAACGFPYFLSGDIDSFSELTTTAWGEEKTPAYFKASKDIEVLTGHEAMALDRSAKTVHAVVRDSGESRSFPYDALILATGAAPVCPAIPGIDRPGVGPFTRPDDVKALREALQRNEIGRVAVVGGGYIGLELAEAFTALWGVDVLLLEQETHVMPANLDAEMAALVEGHLREEGVDVRCGARVSRIYDRKGSLVVCLNEEREEVVDRVVLACGVRPQTALAKAAGLEIGDHGGVLVDAHGQTSDPAIHAAGDCAELPDAGSSRLLPLGSIANRMGRIVANHIAGVDALGLPRVRGTGVVKVLDRNVASVGLSAAAARVRGLDVEEYWGCFPDRAHYYPEAKDLKLKLVREANGPLLGLQAIGDGEVVRWVDAFALILELADGDPAALQRFEHAYAPPFATAQDPLHHMAAMIEAGPDWQLPPQTLAEGGDAGWRWIVMLEESEREGMEELDVRGKVEFLTLAELRERAQGYEKQEVVLVCARGPRSYEAARLLRAHGARARYLAGGMVFQKP